MHPRPAFALTDLLASVAGLAVLLSVSAVTLADNGTNRDRRQNATQLRGIHQGLVTWANSNKEFFPGMDSRGNIIENSLEDTGNSGDGDTAEARYWLMMNGDFFTPGYALNPVDTRAVEAVSTQRGPMGTVTHDNYSYAMLDIAGDAPDRHSEWSQTLNTQAIVLSDRNCSDLNEEEPFSVWDQEAWAGHILWNDNHVEYTADPIQETRYGSGDLNVDDNGDSFDDLFTIDTNDGADALMTFSKDEDGAERAVPGVVEEDDDDE